MFSKAPPPPAYAEIFLAHNHMRTRPAGMSRWLPGARRPDVELFVCPSCETEQLRSDHGVYSGCTACDLRWQITGNSLAIWRDEEAHLQLVREHDPQADDAADYSEAASGYNSPPHLIAEDKPPQPTTGELMEGQSYNCPCAHPSQCDDSCMTPAPQEHTPMGRHLDATALRAVNAIFGKMFECNIRLAHGANPDFPDALFDAELGQQKALWQIIVREALSTVAPAPLNNPYAAATTDYLGCEYIGEVEQIKAIAAAGSKGPAEITYLYAGPPPAPQALESPRLERLLAAARAQIEKMSEAEIDEMLTAQRKSWVRGMTTPCEHGILDFEQCSACRNPVPLCGDET